MHDFEKLGSFYLGRAYDLAQGRLLDDLILYDANDLTTHGLCIGMTGSGKTGLCIDLLEEAAIDGVPALVVDPKGDLGNLLLTFPDLRPEDFGPWVDEEQAARQGLAPEAYAAQTAEAWRKGLADWGQDGARIARLKQAADAAIYTPGSTAGLSVSVLRSFDAPPAELLEDSEALRDRIQGAVSGLLALLGIEADPVASREHVLLSTILERAWTEGRPLDLPSLIGEVQQPPFSRIGVLDLDAVYPQKDRFDLAIRLNQLLASPSFAAWMEGEPLDVGRLLYTPEGRPRIAVLSIAHLSDPERMFFVTLLLNEVIAWMRRQPGTPSLRALLYMDEVFGFFPPTAMPPSKRPMLTLLKQARAFGLGVVLATQNPVDLDYKALANMGTWLIGRLQTERDKARVLDGLEGAAATTGQTFDRGRLETTLASLGSRVFLMHNVHESEPVVFQSRWALSYLRGPLTREQIKRLMVGRRPAPDAPAAAESEPPAAAGPPATPQPLPERPLVAAEVSQYFLPLVRPPQGAVRLVYRPAILAAARLHYVRAGVGLEQWTDIALLADLPDSTGRVAWETATVFPGGEGALESKPPMAPAEYAPVPAELMDARKAAAWQRDLTQYVCAARPLRLWQCAAPKQTSNVGETEAEFRARLAQLARERRDLAVAKLRAKYAAKLTGIQERVSRAEERLGRERAEQGHRGVEATLSVGATLVGALFGRKIASRRNVSEAASAVRRVARAARGGDEAAAEAALSTAREQLAATEQELTAELQGVEAVTDAAQFSLTELSVPPRKSDLTIHAFGLAWMPWAVAADGTSEPLFRT